MGIKEKDLQTIEQLSDGDKLRVVTSEGNSRNIPADTIGGLHIEAHPEGESENFKFVLDKTFEEITNAYFLGQPCVINISYIGSIRSVVAIQYMPSNYGVIIIFPEDDTGYAVFSASTTADYPSYSLPNS